MGCNTYVSKNIKPLDMVAPSRGETVAPETTRRPLSRVITSSFHSE